MSSDGHLATLSTNVKGRYREALYLLLFPCPPLLINVENRERFPSENVSREKHGKVSYDYKILNEKLNSIKWHNFSFGNGKPKRFSWVFNYFFFHSHQSFCRHMKAMFCLV